MSTFGGREVPIRSASALGRTIQAARHEAGWTQGELADRARMNRFAVASLEEGKETRAIEQIFDTLAALDLELTIRSRMSRDE